MNYLLDYSYTANNKYRKEVITCKKTVNIDEQVNRQQEMEKSDRVGRAAGSPVGVSSVQLA